jgi:exodeoxyribonuclease III
MRGSTRFWRNAFERDAGLRIDHAVLSPDLAPLLRSATMPRGPHSCDHTSDHAPVMMKVDSIG